MMADIGSATTREILNDIRSIARKDKVEPEDIKSVLRARMVASLSFEKNSDFMLTPKFEERIMNTIDGSGYVAKLETDRELLPVLNSSRILGHLGLLAQHPDALCQHTVSSTLRSILFSSSTDQEALKHKPSIDLALGVLSLSLQADVYPDDRTCELMAKTLLRHGYSSISQRLFAYLRFQGFLCGLSSYKILVNYLVRHASNMEVPDFDAVIEIIDHVHTLEASQNQYTAVQGRLSRLLAEHMMLQIIREGTDTDDGVAQQLKKYTNADILSA